MSKLTKPQFIKIKDLQKSRNGYNIYLKVISIKQRQVDAKDNNKVHMIDVILADQTGAARGFFKGQQTKQIKQGGVIAIRNGVKRIVKNHISLQVDLFGRVTQQTVQISPNTQKNISDQEVKPQTYYNNREQGGKPGGRRQFHRRFQQGRFGGRGNRRNDRRDDKFSRGNRQDKHEGYGKDYQRQENRDNRYERDNRDYRRGRNDRNYKYDKDDRANIYEGDDRDKRDERDERDNRYTKGDRDDRDNRNRKEYKYNRYGRDNRGYKYEDDGDNRNERDDRDNRYGEGDWHNKYRKGYRYGDDKDNRQRRDDENYKYGKDDRDYRKGNNEFNKRSERDYDRKNKNFDERNERIEDDFKQKQQPMIKINQIQPGKQNFRFAAKVLSISDKNGSNIRCVLGDQTGTVNAQLSERKKLEVGKTFVLFGAEASVIDEHILIQKARVSYSRYQIAKINQSFDLSKTAWQAVY